MQVSSFIFFYKIDMFHYERIVLKSVKTKHFYSFQIASRLIFSLKMFCSKKLKKRKKKRIQSRLNLCLMCNQKKKKILKIIKRIYRKFKEIKALHAF